MSRLLMLVIFFGLVLNSCGPNKKELETRKQFVEDSLTKVKEMQEQERIHKEKIEVGKSIKRTKLKNYLNELKAELVNEKTKLDKINEFQFGRTHETKQRQLHEQQKIISDLEIQIRGIEKEVAMAELFNSFDFQLTPEGTINHIFDAAKSGNLDKMRHLVDPYGEFDTDALMICIVDAFPPEAKERWINSFKNGRIMGEPVINGDQAIVEIAVGPSSNELEKITLVKRMDKWYVLE